jgi:hypothetical protein
MCGWTAPRFTPAEKSAEATIQESNLALTPLQPYVAQVAFLALDSGAFSLAGEMHHTEGEKGPGTTFSGNADILNLLVSESETGHRFLAWEVMKASDIKLGLSPERLEIGEVGLSALYGNFIILLATPGAAAFFFTLLLKIDLLVLILPISSRSPRSISRPTSGPYGSCAGPLSRRTTC